RGFKHPLLRRHSRARQHHNIMASKVIVRSKSKAIAVKRLAKSNPAQKSAAKNSLARRKAALPKSGAALGVLPEWNLADLYSGLDDPAVKRDLDRIDSECLAFEEAYKGKLAELAQSPEAGSALAEAVQRYEAIDDLMGRIGSYAGLLHAGDTVDPARIKFY